MLPLELLNNVHRVFGCSGLCQLFRESFVWYVPSDRLCDLTQSYLGHVVSEVRRSPERTSLIKPNDPLDLFTASDCPALGNPIEDTLMSLTLSPALPCCMA